jgi:cytochrome c553
MTSAQCLLAAFTVFAVTLLPARAQDGSAAAGKTKAQLCAACHGQDGVSTMALTPSLAGQPDEYIQWQLVYFRSGARKSQAMQIIAGQLKNQDIRDLGAYYASLKPPLPEAANPDDALAQKGGKIAAQQRCRSCHYDKFEGYRSSARLASQREDVLLKALHDYKSGARLGSGVASMADVVYPLNDDDMKALAHFMATHP